MKLKTKLSLAAILALSQGPTYAITTTLNFTSLPSAQGWNYFSTGPLETDVYSVDGSKLIQNTLGTGFTAASYQLPDAINPNLPFTIAIRSRVIMSEQVPNPYGTGPAAALLVIVLTGTEMFGFGLNESMMHAPYGTNTFIPIDGTQFHDYRIEAIPGNSLSIFADNTLMTSGAPIWEIAPSKIDLGNNSGYEKGIVEITAFSFTQAVPEPASALLLFVGAAALAAYQVRTRAEFPKNKASATLHPTGDA